MIITVALGTSGISEWGSFAGGAILAAMGLGVFLAGVRLAIVPVRSSGLVVVLVGFFVMFSSVLWRLGEESPGLSAGMLAGAVATFRLMASFEPPSTRPPGSTGPSEAKR